LLPVGVLLVHGRQLRQIEARGVRFARNGVSRDSASYDGMWMVSPAPWRLDDREERSSAVHRRRRSLVVLDDDTAGAPLGLGRREKGFVLVDAGHEASSYLGFAAAACGRGHGEEGWLAEKVGGGGPAGGQAREAPASGGAGRQKGIAGERGANRESETALVGGMDLFFELVGGIDRDTFFLFPWVHA
jgi:hypothetical protein